MDSKNDRAFVGSFSGFCFVAVVLAAWLSITTVSAGKSTSHLGTVIVQKQADLLKAQQSMASQPAPPTQPRMDDSAGMQSFERFHSAVLRSAAENRVVVGKFSTGGDLQPHQSPYNKTPQADGYSQLHVQLSLTGSLGNVVSTLRAITSNTVIFEIGSIDFNRTEVKPDGSTLVSADVSVNLLTKGQQRS